MIVADNFSRAASSYHEEAFVQRHCASKLLDYLLELLPLNSEGKILEIGCGTGFVTKDLLRIFHDHECVITDLSQTMLTLCKKHVCDERDHRVVFHLLDGENCDLQESFSLIISGMAFQWFRNFNDCVSKFVKKLSRGGMLAFSYLNFDSYPEWKLLCEKNGLPYSGNSLPQAKLSASSFSGCQYFEHHESLIVHYENMLSFLKTLKRLGMGSQVSQKDVVSNIHLLRKYGKKSTQPITYSITYSLIRKL